MAERQKATPPKWMGKTRLRLLWSVLAGGRATLHKIWNTFYTLSCWFGNPAAKRRVQRLKDLGYSEHVPSISQMLVAGRDQILIGATDETKEFYESQGIPWAFHNFRRFLQDPSTMLDPIGVLAHRDSIINHVLQTFHRHPVYDWGLLHAHENGVEEFDRQLKQFLKGDHLHQRALESLIEDGSYHDRLVWQWEAFKENPYLAGNAIPENLVDDPYTMMAMDQFKDIRGFMAYASRLNVGPLQVFTTAVAVALGRGRKRVVIEACDPDIVKRHIDAGQSQD